MIHGLCANSSSPTDSSQQVNKEPSNLLPKQAVILMLTPIYEHGRQTCAPYWPMRKGDILSLPSDVSSYDSDGEDSDTGQSSKPGRSFQQNNNCYRKIVCQEVQDNSVNPKNGDPSFYPHVYSCFTIESENEPPIFVHHFHVDSWVDFSCPVDGVKIENLVLLVNKQINKVDPKRSSGTAPLIVHCSAGVGRTGTYLALDYMLTKWTGLSLFQQLNYQISNTRNKITDSSDSTQQQPLVSSHTVYPFDDMDAQAFHPFLSPESPAYDPIFVLVNMLRKQRVEMVQRVAQYGFIYENVHRIYLEQELNHKHSAQMMASCRTI